MLTYRGGNARSVSYALEHLGIPSRLVSDRSELATAERVILPGVGSAETTMESLHNLGYVDLLRRRVVDEGILFLGICVGLQVLFEHSEEGDASCLGFLPGKVVRFDSGVRVPQIGWNSVRIQSSHPFTEALVDQGHFYFVNSYYARPADESVVAGTTEYGGEFCSVVASQNIMATQFHIEKSGELGLRLLKRFATMDASELC